MAVFFVTFIMRTRRTTFNRRRIFFYDFSGMENDRRAGMRNWSVEARDRQVHAVSPMHLQESRLINSLLNEAQNISKSNNKINTQSESNF